MGPAPDLDPGGETPVGPDELPIDEELRWLVDYDEALRTGMAITATDGDMSAGTLADGLDALVVLGVDWSRDPEAAAGALNAQLTAKRASDGLSFMAAGTPTNNTGEAPAGDDAAAALDPFDAPPPAGPESAGRRAERALGLKSRSALRRVPGAAALDDEAARHMAHVLWPTTWGYFLDQIMQPLVDDGAEAGVRTHFRVTCAVAGRCPRSASVASPTACSRWSPPRPGRETTRGAGDRQPREERPRGLGPRRRDHLVLGDGNQPENELVRLLRMTPRSKNFRTRQAIGAAVVSAGTGFEPLAPFQELSAQVTLGLAGIEGPPASGRS